MANRLALETSPYLLQHAHNPVDWFPWGEEAFSKSRDENKPIFLSIGYATCHWCHVMERESFENETIAKILNENFVPIKVDREELPDVDQVYMSALQSMTGSGGWPMNMFLLPDKRPFYGGTYWPPQDRHGHPAFDLVLLGVANAWHEAKEQVLENATNITAHISRSSPGEATLPQNLHDPQLVAFSRMFDFNLGGFGGAPKFPHAPALMYLLSQAWLGSERAKQHLYYTLEKMMEGGIYDQVGGGFHRYSVDEIWRVPHFEKMLYDNAQLARVYIGAFAISGNLEFKRIGKGILDYILLEMTDSTGGFWSAQDADSEGVEGKFYVWSEAEIRSVLAADADLAIQLFGVSVGGNWDGENILERRLSGSKTEPPLVNVTDEWYAGICAKLYRVRKQRIHPIKDDKILADWNGLAMSAFAEAGRLLGEQRYIDAAVCNADFVLGTMLKDGLIHHAWREGKLKPQAYLADQANYGLALLELHHATGEGKYLRTAQVLAESIVKIFADQSGGFFDSVDDSLPIRAQEFYDGPYPSGNGGATELLFRLASVFDKGEWASLAEKTVSRMGRSLENNPFNFAALLKGDLVASSGTELAIVGTADAAFRTLFAPITTVVWGDPGDFPVLQNREAGMAYLCQAGACRLPHENFEQVLGELKIVYPSSHF